MVSAASSPSGTARTALSSSAATITARSAVARGLRAKRQRGASVLIVFMVLSMLIGIGMFAARSSTLSMTVSGSSKQLAQTRYLTEYAITNAAAALARDPKRYVDQMPKYVPIPNDPKCYGFGLVPNATCFPLSFDQLEADAGMDLVVPGDKLNNVPGGLGHPNIEADFNIDMTDLMPAAPPVPGESLNAESPVSVSYWSVTLTATGQLRPTSTAASFKQTIETSASVQTWRAHVVVGPLSNPAARQFVP